MDNLAQAIASYSQYGGSSYIKNSNTSKIQIPKTSGNISTSFTPPFGGSGLWLLEEYYQCNNDSEFKLHSKWISRNNLGVSVIYTTNEVVVWVTTTDTNEKVQGAKVTIWGSVSTNPDPSSVNPLVNQDYATDSDGLVIISDLSLVTSSFQAYVIVNYNELIQISFLDMQAPAKPTAQVISTIITDRSFYAPGETIYLKGYLQSRLDDVFTVPDAKQAQLSIQWNDDLSSYVSYNISILSSGTFSYNITIPDDASSTQKYLQFNIDSYSESVPILIATPRIPTVSLSLSSSEVIFRPQKAYPLNISLETYTGFPVASGLVKIQWSVSKYRPYWYPLFSYGLDALYSTDYIGRLPPSDTVIYSGAVDVSVDVNGQLTNYLLDLKDVSVQEGNSIKITAQYFSPTKELVMEEINIPIAYSPLSLSIRPTVSGVIIPGYKFGVFANVQDLSAQGNTISGTTVSISLYNWDGFTIPSIDPQTGVGSFQGKSLQDCTLQTLTSSNIPGCTDPGFSLPSIGNYLLVGTVTDSNNYVVTTIVPVGYNETEWKNNPRSSFNNIEFNLDKVSYNRNDDVYLEFYNPYPQSLLLYYWGVSPNSQHKITTPAQGLNSILINLGNECLYGCNLHVVLVSPRISSGSEDNSVPTSILFDPLSPDVNYNTLPITINVPARSINVSISTEDIVEPGKSAQLMVNLTQDGTPISGEVAIFIVDKAALDLKPNPIPFYNESLSTYLINQYYLPMIKDSRDRIASAEAFLKIREIIQRRLQKSPWYSPNSWPVLPQSTLSEFDVTDEEFFYYYNSIITEFPVSLPLPPWQPHPIWSLMNVAFDGARSSSAPDTSSAPPLTIRSNFKTTALFVGYLEVDSTGSVVIPYTLPDNIGTFEIRAYAFNSKSSSFGVGVKDQITRRDFSLQPSLPRIVRNQDQFSAGVSLTIADPKFSGSVTVSVDRTCELLALAGPDTVTCQLTGSGPHLMEFKFVALGTGSAGLIFKVSVGLSDATGNQLLQLKDAVFLLQDIAGQQEPVFIATSMPVSGNSSDTEGFIKPQAVPYSGNLSISVGVGKVPAIETLAEIAINSKNSIATPSADNLLASMVPYIALSKYSESIASNYSDEFSDSVAKLKKYTDPYYGLQFYPIDVYPNQFYTSVRLQTFALYVLNEASKLPNPDQLSALDESGTFWTNALITQLKSDVQASKLLNGIYDDYETLAFVYLALGSSYAFDVEELQLSRVLNNTDKLSNQAKAALALALLRDNVETTTANNLLKLLTNTFRVQGRTAYISSDSWPNFLASGIALQAYVLSESTDVLVEKLSNFVAQDGVGTDVWWWYSGEQLSHYMLALSSYDLWKGNTKPQLNVEVISGEQILLNSTFDTVDKPVAFITYYFEDIGDDLINFTACCVGEASVVFGAKFVPLNLPTQKIERGITVNRIIQLVDSATNNATGPNIVEATIGNMVMTTIQITVPDYSPSMRIVDPFPGAFEPLDDNIFDVPPSNSMDPVWKWYWGAFPIKEFLKDKVVFHGQNIYPGTYTVSYYSIVNTQGSFVLSPTLAYDVFQPELMGLSEAGKFSTTDYVVSDVSNQNSSCLPWTNRNVTPEDLEKWLNNNDLVNDNTPDPADLTDGFKATDGEPKINRALALGLGLGIGLPCLIFSVGTLVYFIFNKQEEQATVDPTTTVTSIPV